jgi:hypothetical protein
MCVRRGNGERPAGHVWRGGIGKPMGIRTQTASSVCPHSALEQLHCFAGTNLNPVGGRGRLVRLITLPHFGHFFSSDVDAPLMIPPRIYSSGPLDPIDTERVNLGDGHRSGHGHSQAADLRRRDEAPRVESVVAPDGTGGIDDQL